MPKFDKAGKPVTEEEVREFERKHRIQLPSSYRRFLLETNGGEPIPNRIGDTNVERFYSLKGDRSFRDLDFAQDSFDTLPEKHVAIGRDPFGDAFVLDCDSGGILQFDHERWEDDDCMTPVASNFDSFLSLLRDDE